MIEVCMKFKVLFVLSVIFFFFLLMNDTTIFRQHTGIFFKFMWQNSLLSSHSFKRSLFTQYHLNEQMHTALVFAHRPFHQPYLHQS